MRILYIASNTADSASLLLEHEISRLQRQVENSTQGGVSFHFHPALAFQEIRHVMQKVKPHIVHISSHGSEEGLFLADTYGGEVKLTNDKIAAAFGDIRPTVLFLSACHSGPVAKSLSGQFPVVIGTNADVENYPAHEAAAAFYDSLAMGNTIEGAYDTSSALLMALSGDQVKTEIYAQKGAARRVLFNPPQLLARFGDTPKSGKWFYFEPGFLGAPKHTMQTLFFTDDPTFKQPKQSWEESLCWIARGKSYNVDHDVRWLGHLWSCVGDFELYATATAQQGEFRTVYSHASDALSAYYRIEDSNGIKVPKKIWQTIDELRSL